MKELILTFIVSVLAGIAANCVSKWLERKDSSDKPKNE